MIAARRDYAPYAELRTDTGTDMYRGGLPVAGNWVRFSVDESDESVREAVIGEQNEKRRVEYASRESGGMEFSGYTAMTNFELKTDYDQYVWDNPRSAVDFTWTGDRGTPARLQAETFDIGVPITSGQAIDSVIESIALPGERVSAQKKMMVSAKTEAQTTRPSRTQTENAGVSHEVQAEIQSAQAQVVRTEYAAGKVDDTAFGNIATGNLRSPYFNVDIGYLNNGTELDEDVLGAKITPVTLEWIKETGTISSPSAGFTIGSVQKKVPNWYYEEIRDRRIQGVQGVVCQCATRVVDSTLGIIMYCPNSYTVEDNNALILVVLEPGRICYGQEISDFNYEDGEEPQSVDGAKLLGRRNPLIKWPDDTAKWQLGGDWQTKYDIIDVSGGNGKIAYPASTSEFKGIEEQSIGFESTTKMMYYFPFEADIDSGVDEFRVGPVASYYSQYSSGRISAYTIAQAGNTTGTRNYNQLLRQAKEVFPARILRISAHTETDEGCRSMNGFSTSNLNAEYTESGHNERSVSAVPRALLTTTHDCSSRLMASFSVDTNISSVFSLPSAVSASVIHDDGYVINSGLSLTGGGGEEQQYWPGKDFGYLLEPNDMMYKEPGGIIDFDGSMNTLVYYDSGTGKRTDLYQLPTYVVRGAMKGSSRSTLFSQTAYLLYDASGFSG